MEKAEQDFDDMRNLQARNLAEQEAVKNTERKLEYCSEKTIRSKGISQRGGGRPFKDPGRPQIF